MKIKPLAFGAALGLVWGGSVFVTTWLSYYTGYGKLFLKVLAQSIYPFYTITPLGSFIGLVGGFIDGFVSGALIVWIYNRLAGNR